MPSSRRLRANSSDGYSNLHVNLSGLDGQGQAFCGAILKAFLNLSGDDFGCLDKRRQPVGSSYLEAEKDRLPDIGQGRVERLALRDAAGHSRAND